MGFFVVPPTGSLDIEDKIKAELVTSEQLQISFSWPPSLTGAHGIMNGLISFCHDLYDVQGPLLAQGIRDYTDPLQSEVNEEVV